MTTKHTGGHAFPTQSWEYDVGDRVLQYQEPGMSLRDYFAAKAMQGILPTITEFPDEHWRVGVAMDAYAMADAMLEAREEK